MDIELFASSDRARLDEAIALRVRVFVDEQRVPIEEEVDANDAPTAGTIHALARDETGAALGTGRFYDAGDGTAQIGRMAVRADARARGVGAGILKRLLEESRLLGFTRAALLAQDHAVGFYARFGFEAHGETLLDGGIVHQPMERALG